MLRSVPRKVVLRCVSSFIFLKECTKQIMVKQFNAIISETKNNFLYTRNNNRKWKQEITSRASSKIVITLTCILMTKFLL